MTEAAVQRIESVAVSQRVPIAVLVVVVLAAPWVVYPVFAMKALCFALFACAFNLLLGYVGLLSFGHALFFGGASYASAHAALEWGWPPELAILFSMVVGAALGLGVGLIAIRRQGIYFAMITLALAQMFYFFCLRAEFTGGENGIQGVPEGDEPHVADEEVEGAGEEREAERLHGEDRVDEPGRDEHHRHQDGDGDALRGRDALDALDGRFRHDCLPKSPAGRTSRTSAITTKITVFEASG